MILLVTYELKSQRDYTGLYNALKNASTWWHYLDSVWLLETDESPETWRSKLQPQIDEVKDSLFITQIDNNYAGWLPKKAWVWISEKFSK